MEKTWYEKVRFRGWAIAMKQWVYGDLRTYINGEVEILVHNTPFGDKKVSDYHIPVHSKSVSQWTGQQDTTGKDLYFGDIVRAVGDRNVYGRRHSHQDGECEVKLICTDKTFNDYTSISWVYKDCKRHLPTQKDHPLVVNTKELLIIKGKEQVDRQVYVHSIKSHISEYARTKKILEAEDGKRICDKYLNAQLNRHIIEIVGNVWEVENEQAKV